MKKRVLIASACCAAALAVLLVALTVHRGRIDVIIDNKLADSIRVVGIQDEDIDLPVPGNRFARFSYRITRGGAPINLRLRVGEQVIDKDIVDYVERAYRGEVWVTVSRNAEGDIDLSVKSNVSL